MSVHVSFTLYLKTKQCLISKAVLLKLGSLAQLPQKCGRNANSRPGPASDLRKQILQAGSSYPCFNKPPDNSDAHSSLRARDLKRYKLRVEPGRINFKVEDILLSRLQGPMASQRSCHQQTLSPLHRRRGADAGPPPA